MDATTGTSPPDGALLKWDLAQRHPHQCDRFLGQHFTLYVTDASPLVFNLYNMRRTWVEGTSTQTNSTTSANWNTYDGVNSWGAVGVADTSSDRYDTNLWGAGTSSFSTTGSNDSCLEHRWRGSCSGLDQR